MKATALIYRGGVEDTRLEATDTKKSEAKAKDSLCEDRHSRGQRQECSRPRPRTKDTSTSALQKKKVFTKIFQAISTKKLFQKIFQALPKILTIQKIVLSSSRGQANFRGLEASRPRPRTSKSVLEDSTSAYLVPDCSFFLFSEFLWPPYNGIMTERVKASFLRRLWLLDRSSNRTLVTLLRP